MIRPDLDAIRAALDKMTPGPWMYSDERNCVDTAQIANNGDVYDGYSFGASPTDNEEDRERFRSDGPGVSLLRNAAPALLDRIVDLEAALAEALDFADGCSVGVDVPRFFSNEARNILRLMALLQPSGAADKETP